MGEKIPRWAVRTLTVVVMLLISACSALAMRQAGAVESKQREDGSRISVVEQKAAACEQARADMKENLQYIRAKVDEIAKHVR